MEAVHMLVDEDLAAFIQSPVMIILGSCDGALRPQIGRAVGAVVNVAKCQVDLIVSTWQWPDTVANVRGNAQLSATFARPSDYVSYQIKGRASVIPASAKCRIHAKHYIEKTMSTLAGLGLDKRMAAVWFADRQPVVLSLSVEAVFVQTPGDQAGQMLERHP